MKVFCADCKHYYAGFMLYRDESMCLHPENEIEKEYYREKYYKYRKKPKKINKKNNCSWYEKRK